LWGAAQSDDDLINSDRKELRRNLLVLRVSVWSYHGDAKNTYTMTMDNLSGSAWLGFRDFLYENGVLPRNSRKTHYMIHPICNKLIPHWSC